MFCNGIRMGHFATFGSSPRSHSDNCWRLSLRAEPKEMTVPGGPTTATFLLRIPDRVAREEF